MTATPNLGLHTWAPEDPVNVAEVNENFSLLDQSCAGLSQSISALTTAVGSGGHTCRIAFGNYTGTGTGGSSSNRKSISPGFTPVALLIGPAQPGTTRYAPTIFLRDKPNYSAPMQVNDYGGTVVWESGRVSWYSESDIYHLNSNGWVYYWVAIGY